MTHDSSDVPDFWSSWEKTVKKENESREDEIAKRAKTSEEINLERRQAYEDKVAEETNSPAVMTTEQLLAKLAAELEENKMKITEINFELNAYDSRMSSFDDQIKALEEKKRQVKADKSKYETKRFDVSRSNRQLEDQMQDLKRKMALEEANRLQKEKELALRISLDELTANAPWRNRAKPHQLDGMHFITAAQRVIVADEMGTGKTLQAIMSLGGWQAMQESKGIVLVIAPGDLCDNFMIECDKWDPERLVVNVANLGTQVTLDTLSFYGSQIDSGDESDITILINYEILPRSKSIVKELIAWQFDTVICDEAHRLKNTETGTFKAVKQIVHSHNTCPICSELTFATHKSGRSDLREFRFTECMAHGTVEATRSVVNYMSMTGTPILNKPEEIYASLHLINDRAFPELNDFRHDYCYRRYDGKWLWTPGGESRLVNKIKGMYLRRTVADAGIVLPPQDIQVHDIVLDTVAYKKQAEILRDLIKECQIRINEKEAVSIDHVMALITRQRQATVWPGGIKLRYLDTTTNIVEERYVGDQYLESQKLDWACDLMDEWDESGIRYIVFSQFREPLVELGRRRGDKCVEFHGGTDHATRALIRRNFDRDLHETPRWNGVLAHYKLGGEGLNLTAATQTIILDEQWNHGMAVQAYKRTQRMGQTENTGVHIGRLVGKGSLDQWMAELVEQKQKMVEGFDTEITFQQLADIFNQAA